MSGTERRSGKLGVSMKIASGKVKIYKASRILSIPAPVVNGCLSTQKEEQMDLPVCPEVREIVFLWEGSFVRSTVSE